MNRIPTAKSTLTLPEAQALVDLAAMLVEQPEDIKAVIKEAYWRTARELANEVKRKSSSSHKQVLRRLLDWRKDQSLTGKKGPSRCNFGVLPELYTKLLICQEANFRTRAELSTIPASRLVLDWGAFLLTLLLEKGLFYFVSAFCQLVFRYNSSDVEKIDNQLQAEAGQWFSQSSQARANRLEMVSRIKTRYGPRLQTEIVGGKEEEFIRSAQLHEDFACVNQLFRWLMPPLPDCFALWKSPQGWQSILRFQSETVSHKTDRAVSNTFDQIQLHRLHALLHNDCFAGLCAQAQVEAPDKKLNIPQVFESSTTMNKFNHNADTAVPLDRQQLAQELTADIARAATTAEQFAGQRLAVFVNEQPVGMLEPGATIALDVPVTESQIIKLRPALQEQNLLVASFYLTADDLAQSTSSWEVWSRGGTDYVHKLTIEPPRQAGSSTIAHIRLASQFSHATTAGRIGAWWATVNLWEQVLTPQVLSVSVALAVLITALIDLQFARITVHRPPRGASSAEQAQQAKPLIDGIKIFYDGYVQDRQRRSGSSGDTEISAAGASAQARLERIRQESNHYLAGKFAAKTSSSLLPEGNDSLVARTMSAPARPLRQNQENNFPK